jgi:hypothetical protein
MEASDTLILVYFFSLERFAKLVLVFNMKALDVHKLKKIEI